ncbi:cell wall hydrolase [Salisaeta longa]|uniref:cell wall hydrolase n=1 Tax=Salisaeta longa TaxID=503170 RepID=UPI0003B497C0|nr:cell wall hydrolase [Salisaeta longa]
MNKRATIAGASLFLAVSAAGVSQAPAFQQATAQSATTAQASQPTVTTTATRLSTRGLEGRSSSARTAKTYQLLKSIYSPAPTFTPEPLLALPAIDDSTLWLARCIFSETKKPHEQELVAWVVRNRVETNYRGADTYREVVLDPYQFSAFNRGTATRSFYMNLTPQMSIPGWRQALRTAYYVRHADAAYRPFPKQTRHFFSERSMPNERFPYWADQNQRVALGWNYSIDQRRFRFYKEIS